MQDAPRIYEKYIPDDVLVVVVVIVEAGDDVVDAELVLGVLEQRDEGLLGPFSQLQLNIEMQIFRLVHFSLF